MKPKLIYIFLIFSSLSFPQDLEIEELFNFKFGSSKEEVILQWQNSKLSTFGKISQQSEDTLSLRADNFRLYNGWKFIFVNDNLYEIVMSSFVTPEQCVEINNWLNNNYGEPSKKKPYEWHYMNLEDSSKNEIALYCGIKKDSSRFSLIYRNIELGRRAWDLTINKEFLEGLNGTSWKSKLADVKNQMELIDDVEYESESKNDVNHESTLIYKYGSFANYPTIQWKFSFYYDKLYAIEIIFKQSLTFDHEKASNKIIQFLNDKYGKYFTNYNERYEAGYYWFFDSRYGKNSSLGMILFRIKSKIFRNKEMKLIFKYEKTRLQELRNN